TARVPESALRLDISEQITRAGYLLPPLQEADDRVLGWGIDVGCERAEGPLHTPHATPVCSGERRRYRTNLDWRVLPGALDYERDWRTRASVKNQGCHQVG